MSLYSSISKTPNIFHHFSLVLNEFTQKDRSKEIEQLYIKWLKKGHKILDVGCGDGIITEKLASKFNLDIIGCDIKYFLLKNIPFVMMKNESTLPFPDNHFDTVIFSDVLHHTSKTNQEALIREAVRVTKNNIIINEAKPDFFAYIGDFVFNKISHPTARVTLTFRSIDGWKSVFRTLPVKIYLEEIEHSRFSLFSHFVFLLTKP